MKYTTFIFLLLFSVSLLLGGTSLSYAQTDEAKEQNAIDLGNGMGLFTLTYTFGDPDSNTEAYLPILALEQETGSHIITYRIENKNGDRIFGRSAGLVLSDAPVNEKGMYVVKDGEMKEFTLMVFFSPAEGTPEDEYRLHVTRLPFNFLGITGGTIKMNLQPSELLPYTSDYLAL